MQIDDPNHPVNSLYIIVPVFNETENLQVLFEAFHNLRADFESAYRVRFILVDDGSTDNTADIVMKHAEGIDFVALKHNKNKGPGRAFATAFSHLSDKLLEDDWVITMEGDNTTRYELIRQMFTRTQEGYDVILASPYMYGGGFSQTSVLRKILSSCANFLVKDMLGIQGIFTASSFFRLYRGREILKLQKSYGPEIIELDGFESMVELLLKLVMHNSAISEVPMLLDSSRRKGKSKMKIWRTIVGYGALWTRKGRWKNSVSTMEK